MKIRLATISFFIVSVLVLSSLLPKIYDLIFIDHFTKTQLVYSPTTSQFVYTEKIRSVPQKAAGLNEDHHASLMYVNEKGEYMTRMEFESLLPFLYYRNMEVQGKLPVVINGESYDRAAIEKERRVLELNSRDIFDKNIDKTFYPLIESQIQRVALELPDDRFHMTANSMEFINADTNKVDPELTATFTNALLEKKFSFPCRAVFGNFTIFKPYEYGILLRDAKDKLFHVKRVHGKPEVNYVSLPQGCEPRHIRISENKYRNYLGLLLADDGRMYLIKQEFFILERLPITEYNPDSMDFKVIFDPVHVSAIFSDEDVIHAVVMDRMLNKKASYTHIMSRAKKGTAEYIANILFPFTFSMEYEDTRFMIPRIEFGGWMFLAALAFSLLLAKLYQMHQRHYGKTVSRTRLIFIAIFGLYMFIPCFFLQEAGKNKDDAVTKDTDADANGNQFFTKERFHAFVEKWSIHR